MAADLEKLGAAVVLAPEAGEPRRAAPQDGGRHRDALDIVDRGRAAIKPRAGRERRLEARLALLALEALDLRGFLAADIGARAAMHEHVEIIAGTAGILADEAPGISLFDGGEEHLRLVDELAADVDVSRAGAHRETGDQRALDQLMRIVADDLAVLARARLGFVGIDDQEARAAILAFLGHEAPLHAGREARATATTQARGLHDVDDAVLPDLEQLLRIVPVAPLHGGVDAPVLIAMDVGEDAVLVLQRADERRRRRRRGGCGCVSHYHSPR